MRSEGQRTFPYISFNNINLELALTLMPRLDITSGERRGLMALLAILLLVALLLFVSGRSGTSAVPAPAEDTPVSAVTVVPLPADTPSVKKKRKGRSGRRESAPVTRRDPLDQPVN